MLGALFTDVEFACAASAVGAALGRLERPKQAFRYKYVYNATWRKPCDLTYPAEYGVCHTSELSFVFGQCPNPQPPSLCTAEGSPMDISTIPNTAPTSSGPRIPCIPLGIQCLLRRFLLFVTSCRFGFYAFS
jgi:hypothetical protein